MTTDNERRPYAPRALGVDGPTLWDCAIGRQEEGDSVAIHRLECNNLKTTGLWAKGLYSVRSRGL